MSTLQSLVEHQEGSSSIHGTGSQEHYLQSCLPYLTSKFRESADVVLTLDDDFRCPAHSQLLSAYSEALCHAITASSEPENILRLASCDTRDLVNILDSIYTRGRKIKTVDAAVSLTKLASIFGDDQLKYECDAFLASFADRPCTILAPKVQSLLSLLASCCGKYVELYSVPALFRLFKKFLFMSARQQILPRSLSDIGC